MRSFLAVLSVLCCFLVFKAEAQLCKEYFTSQWANPLNMSSNDDILNNLTTIESSQLGAYSYANGIFSTVTTGSDPFFKILTRAIPGSLTEDDSTRYGERKPIDSTFYKQLTIRMFTDKPSAMMAIWEKSDGTLGSSSFVSTSSGWNTYTINLNVSNWASSPVYSLRIDPSQSSNAAIQIDYIYLTPAGCSSPDLQIAPLRQPDREGGEDYFGTVRGNTSNFDSSSDFEFIGGNSSAKIFPSNSYQDSSGATHKGDYLEATNQSGNGDPVVHMVYPGTPFRIDASRYKIACYTLDILLPVTQFHSVARILWNVDGKNYGTDDIVTKFTGEGRYCFRMDSVQLEPALPNGQAHPWRNNSNGQGLDFLRLDPHEEQAAVKYRYSDAKLAADHEANDQFAIVVGGERTFPVELLYSVGGGSLQSITTLPAGRNSDVAIWRTQNLTPGTYQIYSRSGLNTIAAGGPITVEHSARASDTTAPILNVDAPLEQHNFTSSLQITGYAIDNRRIATLEAKIDDVLVDSFSPSEFDKRASIAYPAFPYNSSAGFNRIIELRSISLGNHSFTLTAYDTAGNTTVHSVQIVKTANNTTPPVDIPFSEADSISVESGLQPRPSPPQAPRNPKLSVALAFDRITYTATARGNNCSSLRLFASNTTSDKTAIRTEGKLLYSDSVKKVTAISRNVPKLKLKRGSKEPRKIYILADCGDSNTGTLKSVDATRFSSRRSAAKLDKVFARLVRAFKKR